ncbi:DNA (cytosine-5-)-methyltransferase [Lyngbya aestuarii]|uniref:DNA (cytosine-5-)-methyltransferase n=1 Tax=Lyngbya aestuarii TaxID=118322 RepID=UPI00403D8346
MSKPLPKVISLFSGAGGLDIGFKKAGFDISVCVESDPACCDTLSTNMKDTPIICKDIRQVTSEEILEAAGLKPLAAALVIGGPPCQPFSLAGNRKGIHDARGTLFYEFVRVVREALPIAFVMENVPGLLNWNEGKAVSIILEEFRREIEYSGAKYQYRVEKPQKLNAVDFGVPQFRERVFFVGNRINKNFEFPQATHYALEKYPLLKPNYKTVDDALANLPIADEPSETAKRVAKTIKARNQALGYD